MTRKFIKTEDGSYLDIDEIGAIEQVKDRGCVVYLKNGSLIRADDSPDYIHYKIERQEEPHNELLSDAQRDSQFFKQDCPFCKKIRKERTYITNKGQKFAYFEPDAPVAEGHLLVVPDSHVLIQDANAGIVIGGAMQCAYSIAMHPSFNRLHGSYDLILNACENAEQSNEHIHVHLIPRNKYDCLNLPWA